MITFSLRPRRRSILPEMAASVRTRVGSWNQPARTHAAVADQEQLLGAHRPLGDAVARLDVVAVANHQLGRGRYRVLAGLLVGGAYGDLGLADLDHARVLAPDGDLAAVLVGTPNQLGTLADRHPVLDHHRVSRRDRVRGVEDVAREDLDLERLAVASDDLPLAAGLAHPA